MKAQIRRFISRRRPPLTAAGTRILLYHAVGQSPKEDALALSVSRERFRQQMEAIRSGGHRVVPLSAVLSADPPSGRNVAITFDDGYRSDLWAAELLRDFGFPATFFLVPRLLDGTQLTAGLYWERWPHLDWDDAHSLLEMGFEIGAHSMTHPDLRRCSPAALHTEVREAKTTLEGRLGTTVSSFSYPFGQFNDSVQECVRSAGFRLACTSRYGLNDATVAPYSLYRTEITEADAATEVEMKLDGRYDWLRYWHDLRRSTLGRSRSVV